MAYTTIDKPTDYFNTKLYTGNGSTQSITGVGFQPDWVWCKSRSQVDNHAIFDSVRGGQQQLRSNTDGAELTRTNAISSFDSDGWSMGSQPEMNSNTVTYASWNWLAGGTASSNTDGSITSSVSANTTAGFSIVSFTGTGSTDTIGHGLGAKPSVIITKRRNSATNWYMYHHKNTSEPETDFLTLNSTSATADNANNWNDTEPTSSFYSVGASGTTNPSGGTMISYCFAEKKGFSRFGSYVGNGSSDGSYIHLGFKPAFVICKVTSTTDNWVIMDNKRKGYNPDNDQLIANSNLADQTPDRLDLLSNGFKAINSNTEVNGSGSSYIYMAFAENPFVTSTGIPTTAR